METKQETEIHECECGLVQYDNGLITWCDAGHIYELDKTDPRYNPQS